MENQEKKTRIKSKEYPAITLNQAIEFIEKLKDLPMSKPISYELAASTIGVSANTKSFRYAISAAKQYGLISTSSGNKIAFLEPAKKLLFPTEDAISISKIKFQCFTAPKIYSELIQEYEGKSYYK